MSEIQTVEARLHIEMYVDCPNSECGTLIDLLCGEDTDGYNLNEDGHLLSQMFPRHGDNGDFECDEVVCTSCKTEFSVRKLEW